MRRKIGIMGGSFNPIHIGHLMVADYVRQSAALDEVWLMISPLNPLKADSTELIDDRLRLAMVEIAAENCNGVRASDFELHLPRPSYTVNTLRSLAEAYPDCDFRLIIGSDNWLLFDRWREGDAIVRDFGVIVYPRPGYDIDGTLPEGVAVVKAPTVDLSSTFIRRAIADGLDMNIFLPPGVYRYIQEHNLYR